MDLVAVINSPITVGVLGAAIGAVIVVTLQRFLSRAHVTAQVTRIQLSAHTLSRVDMINLPENISEMYSKLQAWLPDRDELEANDYSVIPLGRAQEVFIFSKYLTESFEENIALIDGAIAAHDAGSFSENIAKQLLLSDRIDGLITGMLRRLELPPLPSTETSSEDVETVLPIDIIRSSDGETAVRVLCGRGNAIFQYLSDSEKKRQLAYLSYLLSRTDNPFRREILASLRDNMVESRNLCQGLREWFAENLDAESSLIVSVAFANIGSRPAMVNSVATLEVKAADGRKLSIPLRSEDFEADSSNDQQTDRVVNLYKRIAKIFGVAMTFDDKVSFDRTIVSAESIAHTDFRSTVKLKNLEHTSRLLQSYNAANSKVSIRFWLNAEGGKEKSLDVNNVPFGSNEVITERRIAQLNDNSLSKTR